MDPKSWFHFLLLFINLIPHQGAQGLYEDEGPSFVEEPPSRIDFVNDKGLYVNCSARGHPPPLVEWTSLDGTGLEDLAGLRYSVVEDGTLVFVPFKPEAYRPDVHAAAYKCTATNSFGTIVSREVRVRAVVKQPFEPEVGSVRAVKDFPVLLHCSLPSFLRDYVSVTSWIHGSLNILPTLGFDQGKYYMFEDGHLLIWQVSLQDSYSTYQCRTYHRLTGETRVSSPGKIVVVEGFEPSRPLIQNKGSSTIVVREKERLILPCVAYGNPRPETKWFKRDGSKLVPIADDVSVTGDSRLALRSSGDSSEAVFVRYGALIINSIRTSHKGLYVCNVSNVEGSDVSEVHVTVRSNLALSLEPDKVTVNAGKTAEFLCTLSGEPGASVQWLKNGKLLRSAGMGASGGKIRFIGHNRIQIANVQKEDQGIYQCVAKNDYESIQRSAVLLLGDSPPTFLYRFIEQSLQPGPSISLKCSASGNPTPQISWFLDGFELPKSERYQMGQYANVYGDVISHVNISSVRVEDGGQYECVASNRAGRASHGASLNIYGAPFVRSVADITAGAGKPFRFKCPVGGFPIENIVFEKDGTKITSGRRYSIRDGAVYFENMDRTDEGTYSCRASSKQGQSNVMSVNIKVVVPPKVTPFHFPPWVKINERAGIQCIVSTGDPPFELTWSKDKVAISSHIFTSHQDALGEPSRKTVEITVFPAYQMTGIKESSSSGGWASSSHSAAHHHAHLTPPASSSSSGPLSTRKTMSDELEKIRDFLSDSSSGSRGSSKIIIGHSDFSSYLTIPSISIEHMGNYTCNTESLISGETASYTAQLTVNVPPKFTVEPKDQHITVGTQVMIDCGAEGIPSPKISWKQLLVGSNNLGGSSSSSGGEETAIKKEEFRQVGYRTPGVLVADNGSLVLTRVTPDHGGFYMCVATQPNLGEGATSSSGNGGADVVEITKMIHLTVNVPPRIKSRPPKEIVRRHEAASLKCEVTGDEPIHISWYFAGTRIEPTLSGSRHTITSAPSTSNKYLSELTIKQVSTQDRGDYDCVATNSFGQDQTRISLLVHERPKAPAGFGASEKNSRSVILTWSAVEQLGPDGDDTPLTNLVLHYGREPEPFQGDKSEAEVKKKSIPGDQTSVIINNLLPASAYNFYLVATNTLGNSEPTKTLRVVTDSEPPSGPPLDIVVEPVSSTQLQVIWKSVRRDLQHGDILGYNIRFRSVRDEHGVYNWSRIILPQPKDSDVPMRKVLGGLGKFTEYHVTIQGFNEKGPGPFSATVSSTTMEDVPSGPPEGVHCIPLSHHSLQVTWQAPQTHLINGKLLGYRILAEAQPWSDDDNFQNGSDMETKVATVTSTVLHNFYPFTNYSVQLSAFTRVGDGVVSSAVFCQTKESAPSDPSAIKAIMASSQSYVISWLPPRIKNGIILKYNVYVRISSEAGREIRTLKRNLPPHSRHYQVADLKDRESYEAWVTAETVVGEGQSTKSVQFTLAPHRERGAIPAAIISHGTFVHLPWKTTGVVSCENVGEGVTLEWFHRGVRLTESSRFRVLSNSSVLLNHVEKTDSGNISCRVNNQFGSDSITYVLRVQTPPTAPLLHSTGSSSSWVKLQWKQGDNGGAPILAFNLVFRKEGSEWEEITLHRKFNTYLLDNLTCGTSYQFLLSGINKIGTGEPSKTIKASTKGSKPQLPLPDEAAGILQTDATSITLNLSQWLTTQEDCAIQELIVDYQSKGTNWIPIIQNELSGITEISSLAPDTEYKVRVLASNPAGTTSQEYFITTSLHKGGLTSVNFNRDYGGGRKSNTYLILTTGVSVSVVILCVAVTAFYFRRRQNNCQTGTTSATGFQLKDLDREYAVIQSKYIGNPDARQDPGPDVNPYATFQLPEKPPVPAPNYPQQYGYVKPQPRYPENYQIPRNALQGTLTYEPKTGTLRTNTKSYKPKKLGGKGGESDEYDSLNSDSEASSSNTPRRRHYPHERSYPNEATLPIGEKYKQSLKRSKFDRTMYHDADLDLQGYKSHYAMGPGGFTGAEDLYDPTLLDSEGYATGHSLMADSGYFQSVPPSDTGMSLRKNYQMASHAPYEMGRLVPMVPVVRPVPVLPAEFQQHQQRYRRTSQQNLQEEFDPATGQEYTIAV